MKLVAKLAATVCIANCIMIRPSIVCAVSIHNTFHDVNVVFKLLVCLIVSTGP